METRGFYYDGRTSARHDVLLQLAGGRLIVRGGDVDLLLPLSAITISPAVGTARRSLYLPDGDKCEIDDGPFAASLGRAAGEGGFYRWLHRCERNLKVAASALVLTVAAVWGFIEVGIPLLAGRVALAVPPATETTLGKETLAILEQTLFEPTRLTESRQEELRAVFAGVAADLAPDRSCRLLFRVAPALGPNALALPGGTVVVTDELVALAGHDEEIAAVLAHEVGHLTLRHALRQALQNSAAGVLIASLTGDILSTTSLAATLPTMLVNTQFSREMEQEADEIAAGFLTRRGIPLARFAAILLHLQEAHDRRTGNTGRDGTSVTDYFSTHPATRERLERLQQGSVGK